MDLSSGMTGTPSGAYVHTSRAHEQATCLSSYYKPCAAPGNCRALLNIGRNCVPHSQPGRRLYGPLRAVFPWAPNSSTPRRRNQTSTSPMPASRRTVMVDSPGRHTARFMDLVRWRCIQSSVHVGLSKHTCYSVLPTGLFPHVSDDGPGKSIPGSTGPLTAIPGFGPARDSLHLNSNTCTPTSSGVFESYVVKMVTSRDSKALGGI